MKHLLPFLAFLLIYKFGAAQVTVQGPAYPNDYFDANLIWNATIISSQGASKYVDVAFSLENSRHETVIFATVEHLELKPGFNALATAPNKGPVQYGTCTEAAQMRSTGRLPFGEYIACYRISASQNGQLLGQLCEERRIQPFAPPELIYPSDKSTLANPFPLLTWKAPFPPGNEGFDYFLTVVELKSGQSRLAAIERNKPLVSRQIHLITQLTYPADAPRLEEGKEYAWRISASVNGFDLGTTDTWIFKIGDESSSTESVGESYNFKTFYRLKTHPDGGYHPCHQKLKFELSNRMNASVLSASGGGEYWYTIFPEGDQNNPITGLSDVNLQSGQNKIELSLTGNASIIDGQNYLLKVESAAGTIEFLDFTYHAL